MTAHPQTLRPVPRWTPLVVVLLAVTGFGCWAYRTIQTNPDAVFLIDSPEAQWLKAPYATSLLAFGKERRSQYFRYRFDLAKAISSSTLKITAFKSVLVLLDGKFIYQETWGDLGRRDERTVTVPPLEPGNHGVTLIVINDFGPPAFRAELPTQIQHAGAQWEASTGNDHWVMAVGLHPVTPTAMSMTFPTPFDSLRAALPWLAPVFVAVFMLVVYWNRIPKRLTTLVTRCLSPRILQWILVIAIAASGLNNMMRLNMAVGSDAPDHYRYVHYILEHHTLPPPTEGIEAFQTPLAYVIASLAHACINLVATEEQTDRLLRITTLLAGIGLVLIAARLARIAFPENTLLQSSALILSALAPINLYKSPVFSNEPLAALLGALTFLLAATVATRGTTRPVRAFGSIGLVWGLATLTKFSVLVLAPALLLAWLYWAYAHRTGPRNAAIALASLAVTFALVCGGYFARNAILYDKILLTGWGPETGYLWWQMPGYRTLQQYTSFGEALIHPIYAAVHGAWDGLYASYWSDSTMGAVPNLRNNPKWNYGWMLALIAWAIPATCALGFGMLRTLYPRPAVGAAEKTGSPTLQAIPLLCLFAVGAYVASILGSSLLIPAYAIFKGSYLLAASPCIGVLIVYGAAPFIRNRMGHALWIAWLTCYAVLAYGSYIARSG